MAALPNRNPDAGSRSGHTGRYFRRPDIPRGGASGDADRLRQSGYHQYYIKNSCMAERGFCPGGHG